uniref:Uncharacterized protein n=1 Tax=Anguilla anguilla TaxID=7936 RepID=A0A0E9PMS2_ANGAN
MLIEYRLSSVDLLSKHEPLVLCLSFV